MRIQKFSNIRQQNFGDVIVLECGKNVSPTDLDNMIADSPYRRGWFPSDKARLILTNGKEQAELEKLSSAAYLVDEGAPRQQVLSRILERVEEFSQRVKPIIVNSIHDLKGIYRFENLTRIDPVTEFLYYLTKS